VTRIDDQLLAAAPDLAAVASPIVGTDHVDFAAIHRVRTTTGRPLPYFGAPGSTAGGVADHAIAAILHLALSDGRDPARLRVAIWGYGRCGHALARRLDALDIARIEYDPPLEAAGSGFRSAPLDEVLASDAISLHVPLTRPDESPWPTAGMIDARILDALVAGRTSPFILVNTSRGPVVRGADLLAALLRPGSSLRTAIDVWESEPTPDPALVQAVHLPTPHAAGSVFEGRARALSMVRESVRTFLGRGADWTPPAIEGPAALAPVSLPAGAERFRAIIDAAGTARLASDFRDGYRDAPAGEGRAVFDRLHRTVWRREIAWDEAASIR